MFDYLSGAFYGIGITDVVDILIVAFLIYKVLGFIRKTGASQLLKGITLVVALMIVSEAFQLHTINWILKSIIALGAVAILILFQPELRKGLESMGRNSFFGGKLGKVAKEEGKHIVSEIVSAVETFSKDRTGALIVFERNTSLGEIVEKSGTIVDAAITDQILGNIFYEGAPLHDGAVIIKEGRVHAAGCVLPLTGRTKFAKELGTRHRAGLGVTEHSDAIVLIVSEETGIISMAHDGELDRFLDLKTVEKTLLGVFLKNEQKTTTNVFLDAIFKIRGKKNA